MDQSGYGAGTISGHAASTSACTVGEVSCDNTPIYGGTLETQGFSLRGDVGQNTPDPSSTFHIQDLPMWPNRPIKQPRYS